MDLRSHLHRAQLRDCVAGQGAPRRPRKQPGCCSSAHWARDCAHFLQKPPAMKQEQHGTSNYQCRRIVHSPADSIGTLAQAIPSRCWQDACCSLPPFLQCLL